MEFDFALPHTYATMCYVCGLDHDTLAPPTLTQRHPLVVVPNEER